MSHNVVSSDGRRRFSQDLYQKLLELDLGWHLSRRSGETLRIMNRSSLSVTTLGNVFLFTLAPTFFETFLVSAVFYQIGELRIACAVLLSVSIYFVFTVAATKWRATFRRAVIAADNIVGDQSYETLSNIETVKMFEMGDVESLRFGKATQDFRKASIEMTTSLEVLNMGQACIRLTGLVTGLAIAALGTVRSTSRISAGTFVSIQLFIAQLFQPLAWLGTTYHQVTNALTDLEAAMVMFGEIPGVRDDDCANDLPKEKDTQRGGSLVFDNVSFQYRSVGDESAAGPRLAGLKNVSFVASPGRMVAICGASGAGKTTLMRLALRMYDVNAGSVIVNGVDVKHVTQKSLRQRIGVVPQEPTLCMQPRQTPCPACFSLP